MGLFFDNKSETEQDVAETGQQISDFGQGFSLSNVKVKKGDLTINSTDYGAIGKSFELADHTADLSFQAVDSNLEFAGGLVNAVLDSNETARVDSFEFTAGAFQEATDQIQSAWAGAGAAAGNAAAASSAASAAMASDTLEYSAGLTMTTIDALEQSRVDALEFAGGVINFAGDMSLAAIDVSEAARVDSLEFGAGAMQLALETAGDAYDSALYYVDSARSDGLAYSQAASRDALEFGAGAFQAAISASEEAAMFSSSAMNSAIAANNKALDYVQASTESEDKQLAQQLLWGVFALAALMAYKGLK